MVPEVVVWVLPVLPVCPALLDLASRMPDASYTQGLPLYVASNDSAYGFSHYGQFGYVDDCQTGTDDIASESVGQGQYLVSMSLVRHDAVSTKVAPN